MTEIRYSFVNLILQAAILTGASSAGLAASSSPLSGSISYQGKLFQSAAGSPLPLTLMQKGQHHLALGQYTQAEECFRQSAIEHPSDPLVHYYLANALVYLKKHADAAEEYTQSYNLDPYGPVSNYCRKALAAYKVRAPTRLQQASVEPINAAERLGLKLPESGRRGESVQMIRDQVEREKYRHRNYADSISATIVRTGETRAQAIEHDARDVINETLNTPLRIRPFEHPLAAAENRKLQIEQMRKESDEAAKLERSQASEKSEAYKRWSQQHELSLDEVATNLEDQLLSKPVAGSARLRPEGTGLFVRYYGNSNKPQDVHNSVAHFSAHQLYSNDTEENESTQSTKLIKKLSGDQLGEQPDRTVRGAVIK